MMEMLTGQKECFKMEILDAIDEQDNVTIERIVGKRFSINQQIEGTTPLCRAVMKGNKDIVKVLIRHGATVNRPDNVNCYPIHYATMNGFCDITQFLINNCADINIKNGIGETALHSATAKGKYKIVELLINNGADKNLKNYRNQTALDIAINNRNEQMTQLISDKRVKPGTGSDKILTQNQTKVGVIQQGEANLKVKLQQTALDIAINSRNEQMTQLISDKRVKPGTGCDKILTQNQTKVGVIQQGETNLKVKLQPSGREEAKEVIRKKMLEVNRHKKFIYTEKLEIEKLKTELKRRETHLQPKQTLVAELDKQIVSLNSQHMKQIYKN